MPCAAVRCRAVMALPVHLSRKVYVWSVFAPQAAPRAPKTVPRRPHVGRSRPRTTPGRSQVVPRRPKTPPSRSKTAQEVPKTPQDASGGRFGRGFGGGNWLPNGPETVEKWSRKRKGENLDFEQPSHVFGRFLLPTRLPKRSKAGRKWLPEGLRERGRQRCSPNGLPMAPRTPPGRPQDAPGRPREAPGRPKPAQGGPCKNTPTPYLYFSACI